MIRINEKEIISSIKYISRHSDKEIESLCFFKGVKRREYIIPRVDEKSASDIVIWKLNQDGISNEKYYYSYKISKGKMADRASVHFLKKSYVNRAGSFVKHADIYLEKSGESLFVEKDKPSFDLKILFLILLVPVFFLFLGVKNSKKIEPVIISNKPDKAVIQDNTRVYMDEIKGFSDLLKSKKIYVEQIYLDGDKSEVNCRVWSYDPIEEGNGFLNIISSGLYKADYVANVSLKSKAESKQKISKKTFLNIVKESGVDSFNLYKENHLLKAVFSGSWQQIYFLSKYIDQYIVCYSVFSIRILLIENSLSVEIIYRRS